MKRWFALIVALQALFVLGQWGLYTAQAASGRKITLKAVPVDPRSLFMGNYMALDLAIERIDPGALRTPMPQDAANVGDTVYVGLRPGRPYARPVSVSASIPHPRPDGLVYLKGRIVWRETGASGAIRVDYGIERYYFPEDRQQELLEQTAWRPDRASEIAVTVSVPASGRAILRTLHVNGHAVDF